MASLQDKALAATEAYEARVEGGFHCSNEFGAYQFGYLDGYRQALEDAAKDAEPRHVHMDGMDSCVDCRAREHVRRTILKRKD